jgi:hypothetical protein
MNLLLLRLGIVNAFNFVTRLEAMARDKHELAVQYAKHWEIAHQLNAEVNKQSEINARYQVCFFCIPIKSRLSPERFLTFIRESWLNFSPCSSQKSKQALCKILTR